jgi:hypothetical protein
MIRRHGAIAPLLLAATILAACGAAAGPSPSAPVVDPSEGPIAWVTFESDRHGYAIDHPDDWRVVEQPGTPAVSVLKPFSPGVDILGNDDTHRYRLRHGLQVATVEVERGLTLEDFTRSVHMPCGGPSKDEPITVDGERALRQRFACSGNLPIYVQVTALHEGRGYVLWFMTSIGEHADKRASYRAMIDSFDFTDAVATADGN